jgi:hypothetical protein
VVTEDCACGLDGRNEKDFYILLREKQKLDFEEKKRIAIRIQGR